MNRSFPRTQDLTLSVQQQVNILIDRKDAHNMQILQDCLTFRYSTITLLGEPVAKLIRMKVRVFSDSTLRGGVSNPDPSNNRETKIEGCMERTLFVEKLKLAAYSCLCSTRLNGQR